MMTTVTYLYMDSYCFYCYYICPTIILNLIYTYMYIHNYISMYFLHLSAIIVVYFKF